MPSCFLTYGLNFYGYRSIGQTAACCHSLLPAGGGEAKASESNMCVATNRLRIGFRRRRARCYSDAAVAKLAHSAGLHPESLEASSSVPSGAHDIFRCADIEGKAVTMRRRVQIGMGLEFMGTQLANILHASGSMHGFDTFFIENSNAFVALHIFVVWYYHGFLRDIFLARHVTRISLATTAPPSSVALEAATVQDSPHAGAAAAVVPALKEVVMEPDVVFVETGPWLRRIELVPASTIPGLMKSALGAEDRLPFGLLLQMGVLHVDRSKAHMVDTVALEQLLASTGTVAQEEITTDVPRALRAYVADDKLSSFLAEASGDSSIRRLCGNANIKALMQFSGGRFMDLFGLLALTMGAGTVCLWLLMPRR